MARGPDLETDLNLFIDETAEDWGFNKRPDAAAILKGRAQVSALAFARAMVEADGMQPDREPSWVRRLKRRFGQRYRADAITAEEFAEDAWD